MYLTNQETLSGSYKYAGLVDENALCISCLLFVETPAGVTLNLRRFSDSLGRVLVCDCMMINRRST